MHEEENLIHLKHTSTDVLVSQIHSLVLKYYLRTDCTIKLRYPLSIEVFAVGIY